VDDDQSVRWVLEKALKQADMQTRSFERAEHLLEALGEAQPDVLITDVRMPGMSGLALLERLRGSHPDLPIIVITAHSDLESAVSAYKGGAFEYLPKPFDIDEAVELVHKAARQNGSGEEPLPTSAMASMIGQAPAMQEVFRSIGRLAGSSMTVLITGESGTGKELVAQAQKAHSQERTRVASVDSSRPMAERCFSMKSAICRPRCKPVYCVCLLRASFIGSVASERSVSMCESSPQPTRTLPGRSKRLAFERTFTTA
jgi:DNA-binding NtrC family response regulator